MKRFISRYERIRHLRAQQEDVCRAAAAARNAERATAENYRNEVLRWLDTIHNTAARDLTSGLTGGILLAMHSMMEQGEHERHAADDALKTAEEHLRLALENHRHARTELKTMEEIIQREQAEHRQAQLKREEIQLQEQALQAYFRTRPLRSEQ
ncbi:MAG TPA: hypothetical protein PLY87_27270 [Planctomycetaceae bacterium]|nr:hypothetical protein [Planctomycetaceae bacterium]HQZ68830.1 hypothetical protein [Planctomycetaceae bacterium]HRA89367.1 hypothetical protein [Planctomycetaceae bacterium]